MLGSLFFPFIAIAGSSAQGGVIHFYGQIVEPACDVSTQSSPVEMNCPQNKDEVFKRGVINVFRELSWNYKTNSPCKFGSKIIINNLVRWDRWGCHLITGQQTDRLADMERMLHLFSGKPIPDNRENITIRLDGHIQSVQGKERYENEMFIIKYFKKGSAHITFKRLELIDRINDIIARQFLSVLSA